MTGAEGSGDLTSNEKDMMGNVDAFGFPARRERRSGVCCSTSMRRRTDVCVMREVVRRDVLLEMVETELTWPREQGFAELGEVRVIKLLRIRRDDSFRVLWLGLLCVSGDRIEHHEPRRG